MLYAIELKTDSDIYYIGNEGYLTICFDLNQARLFRSNKQINEAIKAFKDDFKHLSRIHKTNLLTFKLLTDTPKQEIEVNINTDMLSLSSKKVSIILGE